MAHSRGTVRFLVRVLQRLFPGLSQEALADMAGMAPNTFAKAIRTGEISAKCFSSLERAAMAALENRDPWRFWPMQWQRDAFALQRAMDQFDEKNAAEVERHRLWTYTNRQVLERLLGYDGTMEKPPGEMEPSFDNACLLHLLGWTYTDLAQLYAVKAPQGPELRAKLFTRTKHCYTLAEQMLGELNAPYLQGRAKLALASAHLAELPLGTAETNASLRSWLVQQNLFETVRMVMRENELDWNVLYLAQVFASVQNDAEACNEFYVWLCEVHPGFESWSYVPNGALPCILKNKDLHYFRRVVKELSSTLTRPASEPL